MLEENRDRMENLIWIQKSSKEDRHMDIIGILLDFLLRNNLDSHT